MSEIETQRHIPTWVLIRYRQALTILLEHKARRREILWGFGKELGRDHLCFYETRYRPELRELRRWAIMTMRELRTHASKLGIPLSSLRNSPGNSVPISQEPEQEKGSRAASSESRESAPVAGGDR